MVIVRLVHVTEDENATAKVFNEYFQSDMSREGNTVLVFSISEKRDIDGLESLLERFVNVEIWPSMFVSEHWADLLRWRDRFRKDITVSYYINTVINRLKHIKATALLMNSNDRFVFNTVFSKSLVEKFLPVGAKVRSVVRPVRISRLTHSHDTARRYQLVVVSRLEYKKNIVNSIQAVGLLREKPPMAICLFSDDSEKSFHYMSQLKQVAKEQGVCIEWIFDSDARQRSLLFRESSLCLVLSTTTEETQGKVIIESAQDGCMPIVNRWNGLPEYVAEEGIVDTGWDEKRGAYINIKQLADKIREFGSCNEYNDIIRASYCECIIRRYENQIQSRQEYWLTGRGLELKYENVIRLYLGRNEDIVLPVSIEATKSDDPIVYLTWRSRYRLLNPGADMADFDREWLRGCQYRDRWYILLSVILDECFKDMHGYTFKHVSSLLDEEGCYQAISQVLKGFTNE